MRRRAARPPRCCQAPGCTAPVKLRFCLTHWKQIPAQLRAAITLAWKQGRISDLSTHCLEAARGLAATTSPATPRVSPEQAFANAQRLMGER